MPSAVPLRGIRMQDELYLKLKWIAKHENRSFNQQAVRILQQFVADYETQNGLISVSPDELYQ